MFKEASIRMIEQIVLSPVKKKDKKKPKITLKKLLNEIFW